MVDSWVRRRASAPSDPALGKMAKSRVGKVRKSRIGALLPVEGGGAPSSGLYFFWKKFSKSRSGALLPVISSREPTCGLYFLGKNLTKSRSGALLPVESNREPTCGLYFFWRNLAKSKPTYQEARAEWVRCSPNAAHVGRAQTDFLESKPTLC